MNKSYSYTAHSICLISVVIFAGGALNIPLQNYNGNNMVAFLAAAALGIAALIILAKCVSLILSRRDGALWKIITVAGCGILLFAAVASAADAILSFSRFVGDVMLPHTSKWLISVCFVATTAVFGFSSESAILKFSLVTAVLNIIVILLLLIYSFGQLSLDNLFAGEAVIGEDFLAQVFKYFSGIFLPAVSALTFIALKSEKTGYLNTVSGAMLGTALLAVCLAQSVMIFGENIASTSDYPYMSAVSTMTTGSLYTRPDGFAYVMFFASYIVKAGVSVSTAVMLIKRIIKKSLSN